MFKFVLAEMWIPGLGCCTQNLDNFLYHVHPII